jgi:hypothetical protein
MIDRLLVILQNRRWMNWSVVTCIRESQYSALVLSICLTTVQFVYICSVGRVVWLDEAMLVRNLQDRNFISLLEPLDYGQTAPLPYLILCKAVLFVTHNADFLRAVSFMFAILGLYLLNQWLIVKEVPNIEKAHLLLVVCMHPWFVRYSTEIKPYILDVPLLYILLLVVDKYIVGKVRWFQLAFIVSSVLWSSNASIFVTLVVLFVLGFSNRKSLVKCLNVLCVYLVNVILIYWVVYKDNPHKAMMLEYWSDRHALLGHNLTVIGLLGFVKHCCVVVRDLYVPFFDSNLTLILVGCLVVSNRSRIKCFLSTGLTLAVQFFFALLSLYPFENRLLLYAVPLVGTSTLLPQRLKKYQRVVTIVVCSLSLYATIRHSPTTVDALPLQTVKTEVSRSTHVYASLGISHTIYVYAKGIGIDSSKSFVVGKYLGTDEIVDEVTSLPEGTFCIVGHPESPDQFTKLVGRLRINGMVREVFWLNGSTVGFRKAGNGK